MAGDRRIGHGAPWGKLVVSSSLGVPSSFDPAFVVYADEIQGQILSITNDGLLSFKKVGGAEGATLIPNLASALPEVSADRPLLPVPAPRGDPLLDRRSGAPEDFRHALERAFSISPE